MDTGRDFVSEKEDNLEDTTDVDLKSKPYSKSLCPTKRTNVCASSSSHPIKDKLVSYSRRKSIRQKKPTFKVKENESKLRKGARDRDQKTIPPIINLASNQRTSLLETDTLNQTTSGEKLNKNDPIKNETIPDSADDIENFESQAPASVEYRIKSEHLTELPCADNITNSKVKSEKLPARKGICSKTDIKNQATRVMFCNSFNFDHQFT